MPAAAPIPSPLIEATIASERQRAFKVAAKVRLAGASLFLLFSLGFGVLGGRADWAVYLPFLLVYAPAAALVLAMRRPARVLVVGALASLLDVVAVYLLQARSLPVSEFPAGVAGFSLGLFALLISLSALTLHAGVIFAVAALGGAGQLLLMRMAGVSLASMLSAVVVLALIAVISRTGMARARRLALGFAQAEAGRLAEQRRLAEVDEDKRTIAAMLGEARRLNDDLARLQRDKDGLVQVLVHDLRSPLTSGLANLGFLAGELPGAASAVTDTLKDVTGALESMSAMIADILDVAKLEEGHITLSLVRTEARALLEAEARAQGAVARERGIELAVDAAPGVRLLVDARLFRRVLQNLVANALRFAPAGSRVLLRAATTAEGSEISVHNQGPAIPAERRRTIFEKFRQGAGPTDGGWGLGLYFCRMAVSGHGGSIAVEDVAGWSTSFVIRLPPPALAAAAS